MAQFHPGCTEIEWLADLKTIAERVGRDVLGEDVRWRVETRVTSNRKRSDVLVETDTGDSLISGEAKRPDDLLGVSPLVDSEVAGAIDKAQKHGVRFCFTTNFFEIALFDADHGGVFDHVERMQGNLIRLVDPSLATSTNWWTHMSTAEREAAVEAGLRELFARFDLARAGQSPTVSIDETVLHFFQSITESLLDPMHRELLVRRDTMPKEVHARALRSGLDPTDDQDCRYLVAQGIAELLSAALFYEVMRQHFGLAQLLRGTSPRTAKAMHKTLSESFGKAIQVTGDYESIFEFSPIATWLIENSTDETNSHWRSLFAFVERLDVASISSDVLGVIFERLISPQRRHEMGSHYTQPRLARSMAAWAVRSPADVVIDPACGAGTFLVETYGRHADMGVSHADILARTFGNDLDPFAVHLATINLVTREISKGSNYPNVRLGDAFELAPGCQMLSVTPAGGQPIVRDLTLVDVVIANPPYSRSHSDEGHALASITGTLGEDSPPPMKSANLAAWFVLLGHGLLRAGGRMAFVLPVSVLQNENLAQWRKWVRARWDLTVWHTENDIWFSDARVASCVILFSPPEPDRQRRLRFVSVHKEVEGELVEIEGSAAPSPASEVRDLDDLAADDDILIAGARPQSLRSFEDLPNVSALAELAGVDVAAGEKLGHSFFKLKDANAGKSGVRRTVTGLNYTFNIPSTYLTPLLDTPKALDTGVAEVQETWMLTAPDEEPTNRALMNYISVGKAQGVHEKPSVKSHGKRWWARSPKVFDVAVPMSSQFQHQIGWMETPGVVNNNFNALSANDHENAEVIAAALASAFGALARLYISGEVGCEGARRILLSQFERWPALDPSKISASDRHTVLTTYRTFRVHESAELDELAPEVLADWKRLTTAVAKAAGSKVPAKAAEAAIVEVQNTVRRRRLREAVALRGRTRGARSSGPRLSTRIRNWCSEDAEFAAAAADLAVGPEIVNIRSNAAIAQGSLFAIGYLAADLERETQLSALLPIGFEAAPPDPVVESEKFDALIATLESLFERAALSLLGDHAPQPGEDGYEMWQDLAKSVRAGVLSQLQSAVREQLH